MAERHVPVLVVGGSLVGLTTSVLLARTGCRTWWSRGIPAPRSTRGRRHSISGRWRSSARSGSSRRSRRPPRGVPAERGHRRGGEPRRQGTGVLLPVVQRGSRRAQPDRPPVSHPGRARTDPAQAASELGAEHMFGTDLVSFEQHDDRVSRSSARRTAAPSRSSPADYLVAADGAHSPVREHLRHTDGRARAASPTASRSTSGPT